jgi:hypothetical protein
MFRPCRRCFPTCTRNGSTLSSSLVRETPIKNLVPAMAQRIPRQHQETWARELQSRLTEPGLSPSIRLYLNLRRRLGLIRRPGFFPERLRRSNVLICTPSTQRYASLPGQGVKVSAEQIFRHGIVFETQDQVSAAIDKCISVALDKLNIYTPEQAMMERSSRPRVLLPHAEFMWLCQILRCQFSNQQITHYGLTTAGRKGRTPWNVTVTWILDRVWNVGKEREVNEQYAVTKSVSRLFAC